MISGHRVVALEEHYTDKLAGGAGQAFFAQLADVHEHRIPDMDRNGIDVQVLSLAPAGLQVKGKGTAAFARHDNDALTQPISERRLA